MSKLREGLSQYWLKIQSSLLPWLQEELGEATAKRQPLGMILEVVRVEDHLLTSVGFLLRVKKSGGETDIFGTLDGIKQVFCPEERHVSPPGIIPLDRSGQQPFSAPEPTAGHGFGVVELRDDRGPLV